MNKKNTTTFLTMLRWNKPPQPGEERCPLQFWNGLNAAPICTDIGDASGVWDSHDAAVGYWRATAPAQKFDIAVVKDDSASNEQLYISYDTATPPEGSRRHLYLNGVLIGFFDYKAIKNQHYFSPRPEIKSFLAAVAGTAAATGGDDATFVGTLAFTSSAAGSFMEERFLANWIISAAMDASFDDVLALWRELQIAELRAHITLSPVGQRDDLKTSSVRRGVGKSER